MRPKILMWMSAIALPAALCVYIATTALPAHGTFPGTNGQITYGRFNSTIGDFQIFVANPDGSHEVQLTTVPSEVSDWSPDGSRIAFDFFDGQTVQIATIKPGQTGFTQLTFQENVFHGEPAWSPDGTKIAIDSDAGNHPAGEGIYIIDASTGTVLSRITANPFGWFDEQPRWSPDGQQIAFTRVKQVLRRSEVMAVFLVRADGTGLRQLTQWGLNAAYPDWSPDGQTISFQTYAAHSGPSSIFTIHPDGSGLTALVRTTGDASFFQARWSPDGTKLIFAGSPDFRKTGNALWTVDANGSNLTQTAISGALSFPAWGTHPLQ